MLIDTALNPGQGKNMQPAQPKSPRHLTALRYAAEGIPIFPCRVNGKEPVFKGSFHNATCDPVEIDRLWSIADYNIGVEPEVMGLAVVDIDNLESWENLVEERLPTFTVTSPSGGRHLYFQGSLPGSAGKLNPGIDTRGRGTYVLVPPSEINGRAYIVSDDRDPTELPAWITERLGHAERVRATAPADVTFDDPELIVWAMAQISEDLAKYDEPQEGDASDERTYRIINKLVDGRRGHSFSPETVVALLHECWAPHFDIEWLERKVDSAQKHRQNPPGCGQPFDPERKYGDPGQWPQSEAPEPARAMPGFRSWPSIRNQHFEPPQWVWQDRLLAFEPNLYTGDAGVGKTTLAENLAVATSTGSSLLGSATRSMPVALLVAEDNYGPVRDNIRAIASSLNLSDDPQLDQIHILSVKSDRVPGGHVLTRIGDQGQRQDTAFMEQVVAPFLRSFDGEVLWIMDPLAEFVAFNNLSDQACRALATNFLADVCSMNGNRVTCLVNDHPSKASMASGAHYAGSVQLKAAFSLVATLIGKGWQGTGGGKQRKLSFEVKKGRYAAEETVEFYRNTTSAAFSISSLPALDPAVVAPRVYHHIVERLGRGEYTGMNNNHDHGPSMVAMDLGLDEAQVKAAMNYCRSKDWLTYRGRQGGNVAAGWRQGATIPLSTIPDPEAY